MLFHIAAVLKAACNHWRGSVPVVSNVFHIVWAFALEPLWPAIYTRQAKGNFLGLEDRTEPLVVALITVTWSKATDDVFVKQAAQSLKKLYRP